MPQIRHKNKVATKNIDNLNSDTKTIDSFFFPKQDNIPDNIVPCDIITNTTQPLNINSSVSNINILTKQDILDNLNNHTIKFSLVEIKNKLVNLSSYELKEIFKIIKINNEKYSINKNGIFINLNILKKTTIQEISDFLHFSDNNKVLDELDELERNKYKNIIHTVDL